MAITNLQILISYKEEVPGSKFVAPTGVFQNLFWDI
tara:strand:+ start:124 stop:231 length:108 start_codon:yes stop_codon:yes gene_type:complete